MADEGVDTLQGRWYHGPGELMLFLKQSLEWKEILNANPSLQTPPSNSQIPRHETAGVGRGDQKADSAGIDECTGSGCKVTSSCIQFWLKQSYKAFSWKERGSLEERKRRTGIEFVKSYDRIFLGKPTLLPFIPCSLIGHILSLFFKLCPLLMGI